MCRQWWPEASLGYIMDYNEVADSQEGGSTLQRGGGAGETRGNTAQSWMKDKGHLKSGV